MELNSRTLTDGHFNCYRNSESFTHEQRAYAIQQLLDMATRTALLSVYPGEFPPRIRFTVDAWIEQHETIARWGGHEEELQDQIEACIRRYRYGSFLTYLFRTLECAGRGVVPYQAYSLDHRKDMFAHDR